MITPIRNQPFAMGNATFPRSLALGCACEERDIHSFIGVNDEVWAQADVGICSSEGTVVDVIIEGSAYSWDDWVGDPGWFINAFGFYDQTGTTSSSYLRYTPDVVVVGGTYIIEVVVSDVRPIVAPGLSGTGVTNVILGGNVFPINTDGTYRFTVDASLTTGGLVFELTPASHITIQSVTVQHILEPESDTNISANFYLDDETQRTFAQRDYPEMFNFSGGHVTFRVSLEVANITTQCFELELISNCDFSSIRSQTFKVVDDSLCETIAIRACNDYDNIGFTNPFVPRIRIPARMGWPAYDTDLKEERHSNGEIFRPYVDRTRSMTIKTGILNQYDHEFLSTLPLWDHVYVGDQEMVVAKGKYEPLYGEAQWLNGAITFEVSPKAELVRKVACGPALAGCAPENDPICFDPNIVFAFEPVDGGEMMLRVTLLNSLNFSPGDASVTYSGSSPSTQTFGTLPDTLNFGPYAVNQVITFRLVNAENTSCIYSNTMQVPDFDCDMAEYGSFTVDGGTEFGGIQSSTGYVTTRNSVTGEVTVFGDGVELIEVDVPEQGTYCFWSSDSEGYRSGDINSVDSDAGFVTVLDIERFAQMQQVIFTGSSQVSDLTLPNTTELLLFFMHGYEGDVIDLTQYFNMLVIDMQGSANLETVILPNATGMSEITFLNCGLTEATVNSMLRFLVEIGISGAVIRLDGGTNAAPTGQGILDVATLISLTNTVVTN